MSFTNPIIQAGVGGLVALFEARAVTPVEACEAYLSRIERLDGTLGAYVDLDPAGALAAAHASAERWARGEPLSAIDGVPIAVKANIAVKGLPWTAGIDAYRDRKAHADAVAVARLRSAGAVILGTTNMHEGAFGVLTDNAWFGRTQNPWRHGHTAGGSSGGSAAATAAGLCAAALGTDSMGSVRIPSSFCGIVGHKPTQGLIPTEGVIALSWTLDHVGVHARSVADAAKLLAAACGAEAELASEIAEPAPLERLREGVVAQLVWEGQVETHLEVEAAVDACIAGAVAAGIEVEPVRLEIDYDELVRLAALVCAAESLVEHQDMLLATPNRFSPMLQERLEYGRRASAADLAGAYRTLASCAETIRETLTPYSGLILPTTPGLAFPFEEEEPWTAPFFTGLANITGLPATAVPAGLSEGRPLSVQVLAWDDETSLGLAQAIGQDIGAPEAVRG
jgi:aspartyl-tRNA(Asn)/glutamyl-tRNA(Gln) amidotransferase subunit A